jgi:hypothetical protein
MPFWMMRAICTSESFCTFGFSAMLGARSPPLPSTPWQFAHVDAKVCLPSFELGVALLGAGLCGAVCVHAANPLAAHKAARTGASMKGDFWFEGIGEAAPSAVYSFIQ